VTILVGQSLYNSQYMFTYLPFWRVEMNLKLQTVLFVLLALVSAATIQVQAQPNAAIIPIKVSDDFATTDSVTLFMVHTPAGTYGKDSINFVFQETEYPPSPPSFDGRWVSFATYAATAYGGGFIPMDIRGIPTNATQKDTFTVSCSNGDGSAGLADFSLRWPGVNYMSARCDSMFLKDKTGQITTDG